MEAKIKNHETDSLQSAAGGRIEGTATRIAFRRLILFNKFNKEKVIILQVLIHNLKHIKLGASFGHPQLLH
jgi:hypothetical protein